MRNGERADWFLVNGSFQLVFREGHAPLLSAGEKLIIDRNEIESGAFDTIRKLDAM
jgi:hypothetical protein